MCLPAPQNLVELAPLSHHLTAVTLANVGLSVELATALGKGMGQHLHTLALMNYRWSHEDNQAFWPLLLRALHHLATVSLSDGHDPDPDSP